MSTAESLYNALINDDINMLTPGSYTDYGFDTLSDKSGSHLFGAYHSILKFMTKNVFIATMHHAFLDEKLHEKVDELTKTLPDLFQNHWRNFLSNNERISPFYI